MALLESIRGPEDIRRLTRDQLQPLADEVRRRLIDVVSQTGGHIGAGLGVVELTVALCYAFDSPRDKIVWDVGHQGYPWKILTGRNDRLPTLRRPGGLSGFLRRSESEHDQFGAGHAGTGLSAAFGMATARDLTGADYKVVAVVGDGALTSGLPSEAMNNAGHSGRDIILVLNDNGMSIAPNVGAINRYLGSIIAAPITVRLREWVKGLIESVSHIVGGPKLVEFARTVEESVKNLWSPGMLFEELGFRYFGPIDGHDVAQMVQTLEVVKTLKGPRVVHVITEKGRGFPLPEPDLEKYHARAPYDPVTGELRPVQPGPPQWTRTFGEAVAQLAAEYPKLVVITAAMPSGTGTNLFQKKWPERFFDVGIAEAHAVTFAAGLAAQGMRPVAAIYSTFLQRAYDSIIHDVAIQGLPVVFCLDRAGMVGEDGQTHMGLYDIAYLLAVPQMTVTAPKDGAELIGLLRCALQHTGGPFSLRYPRDNAPGETPPAAEGAPIRYGTCDGPRKGRECALLAVGAMCQPALAAAEELAAEGIEVTVVNCRFLKPVDRDLLDALLHDHRLLVTVEDGTVTNGFGAFLAALVQTVAPETRVFPLGVPDRTYEHAPRAQQLAEVGLTGAHTPILGVNLGRVGFLTTATSQTLDWALDALVRRAYVTESRLALAPFIEDKQGRSRAEPIVLNDAVVHKGGVARVIRLRVSVDGDEVGQYSADGIVVATPTGSTAYALSAGGPIVVPSVDAIVVAAICPHTLAVRPLVVPSNAAIAVEPIPPGTEEVLVSFDGQVGTTMSTGERLVVKRAAHPVLLVRLGPEGLFARMRKKLQWGDLSDRERK